MLLVWTTELLARDLARLSTVLFSAYCTFLCSDSGMFTYKWIALDLEHAWYSAAISGMFTTIGLTFILNLVG